MPINFDKLNEEINHQIPGFDATGLTIDKVNEAIRSMDLIIADINQQTIESVKNINRSTMRAKDLMSTSPEFSKEVDVMQQLLNQVMISCGMLLPYKLMKEWMEKIKQQMENKS